MDSSLWLLMANAAVWIGMGGYLCFLGANQKRLASRIRQMELLKNE